MEDNRLAWTKERKRKRQRKNEREAYQVRSYCFGVFIELIIMTFWLTCFLAPMSEMQFKLAEYISVLLGPAFLAVPVFFFRKAKKESNQ